MSIEAKRRWSAKLARPIILKEGTTLATARGRAHLHTERARAHPRAKFLATSGRVLMEAAENGGSIEAATAQLVEKTGDRHS
jgi:hypothetical protein